MRARGPVEGRHPGRSRGAFTLIETIVVAGIIAILSAIVIVGLALGRRQAQVSLEQRLVSSLRLSVDRFEDEFGFLPPLVDDEGGPVDGNGNIQIRDAAFLRYEYDIGDPRWSTHTLAFYLTGSLDTPDDQDRPLDGAQGPRMTEPQRDGSFAKRGRTFPPFVELPPGEDRIRFADPAEPSTISIFDRWGTPIRYYRWEPRFDSGDEFEYNTPTQVLGDPETDVGLRSATYAVVSAGPNRAFGDEPVGDLRSLLSAPSSVSEDALRREAREDNLAEVGS